MHQSERIRIFCAEIWRWFSLHRRVLPWRDLKIPDLNARAYRILVSEIMLQQTQVPRVIEMYKKFIQKFPDINALSQASDSEVIIAWRGMGYNSRALRLRDAAWTIVQRYGSRPRPLPAYAGRGARNAGWGKQAGKISGMFPMEMDELCSIPGIGRYTAAAIRNFAFDIPTPCLDTNIRRILHRTFVGPENPDGTWRRNDRQLLELAAKVLEVALEPEGGTRRNRRIRGVRGRKVPVCSSVSSVSSDSSVSSAAASAAAWHSALMDFGSLVCTKTHPKWDQYPVRLRSITKAYGREIKRTKKLNKHEPGRVIEGRFVPNRIIRGRIVNHLRDRREGDPLPSIGKIVAPDWNRAVHEAWLRTMLGKLKRDRLIVKKGRRYLLPS